MLKINKTISAIFSSYWLIDIDAAHSYIPLINMMVGGSYMIETESGIGNEIVQLKSEGEAPTFAVYNKMQIREIKSLDYNKLNVVIGLNEVLMRDDKLCGPVGMMSLASMVNELSSIEKVNSIIFDINSPGGMLDGVQTLSRAILSSGKKTIAIVNEGKAMSGAYWVASSCDYIYASQKTDKVGSIGVYTSILDFKHKLENEGIKIYNIYSRLSGEKNLKARKALGEVDEKHDFALIEDDLDFVAELFASHVKTQRNIDLSKGDPFKGADYYAEEALEIGLIDGIKSFDEVLSIASIKENKIENMNINTKLQELVNAKTEEERTALISELTNAYEQEEIITKEDLEAAKQDSAREAVVDMKTELDDLKKEKLALQGELDELKKPGAGNTNLDNGGEEGQFSTKFKPIIQLPN